VNGLRIAFFGSSLVSAYWNGAATYYRGITKALAALGHHITFYEPDIYERQQHRDIADPPWAKVAVYTGHDELAVEKALDEASNAEVIIKASGVGEFDELLESAVLEAKRADSLAIFWDVDAPATLERISRNPTDPFSRLIPQYDYIFTYGGGTPVANAYRNLGARHCEVVYNALDPDTHHPTPARSDFIADFGLLANRLPDREQRIEEFFFRAATALPAKSFLLGGNGWKERSLPDNVRYIGHVYTADHNTFNCSCSAVLNVNRDSMARFGFSPPTRLFEAAGAAACLITDRWEGVELFLEPGMEVLVARGGQEVADHLAGLTAERRLAIGQAARRRVCAEHTYEQRALQVQRVLFGSEHSGLENRVFPPGRSAGAIPVGQQ
jgi:spore maturation protein CgeB